MEEINVNPFIKEHVQELAKCNVSKEDLTDSIAYFKGKYFIYFYKHCRRNNVDILNFSQTCCYNLTLLMRIHSENLQNVLMTLLENYSKIL